AESGRRPERRCPDMAESGRRPERRCPDMAESGRRPERRCPDVAESGRRPERRCPDKLTFTNHLPIYHLCHIWICNSLSLEVLPYPMFPKYRQYFFPPLFFLHTYSIFF